MNNTEKNDIEIKDFSLSYGDIEVFNSLNLNVLQGEILCVIGPSGCGKSTLLKAIIGAENGYKGKIYIDKIRKDKKKNGGIAYIQQSPNLLPWRTLLQNACLGAEVQSALNHNIINRINDRIEEYGLNGFQNYRPEQLSGGMQQRTAIISALESRPNILLCDEPFNSIDFVTSLELISKFKNHCKIAKRTTLIVTHNIEEAIFLADRIIILSKRPAMILETFRPNLTEHTDDAVLARKTDTFNQALIKIWQTLNKNA